MNRMIWQQVKEVGKKSVLMCVCWLCWHAIKGEELRKLARLQTGSPEIWVREGLEIPITSGAQTVGNKISK